MEEIKKRTKWITIYVSPSENKLIKDAADKSGEQLARFCRKILIDYIMGRLLRLENMVQMPQFSTLNENDQKMLQNISEIKEYIHQNHIAWEIDRAEKLNSIAKIKIPTNNITISERILQMLKNSALYLDQIVEKLVEIGFQVSPKETLKYLADLRHEGKVEQTIEMRWFLC